MEKQEAEFLAKFILESDRIEKIDNNYSELLKAVEETTGYGHVGALLWARFRSNGPGMLQEEDVLFIQRLIVSEQPSKGERALHPRHIGRYRDLNVAVGGNLKAEPKDVPGLMKNLVRAIGRWQKTCKTYSDGWNISYVADYHYYFEDIHPFADGNGRTGRILAYYMLRYAGVPPFVFTNDDREYFRAFKDKKTMREYFLRKYSSSLDPTLLKLDFRKK